MSETLEFDGLNLVVRDMQATLEFYRRLGVSIPEEAVWSTGSGAHHVEVAAGGGTDLSFDSAELAAQYNTGFTGVAGEARTLIGFRTGTRDSVDALFAKLVDAGAKGLQEPYDAFWGARYAIVEDPDGRQVGIMSPVDPAKRSAPPNL